VLSAHIDVACEIADDCLRQLCEAPRGELRSVLGASVVGLVSGADRRAYRVTITVVDLAGGLLPHVRVDDGGWGDRVMVVRSAILPDG
jgi:hypothetical protein